MTGPQPEFMKDPHFHIGDGESWRSWYVDDDAPDRVKAGFEEFCRMQERRDEQHKKQLEVWRLERERRAKGR